MRVTTAVVEAPDVVVEHVLPASLGELVAPAPAVTNAAPTQRLRFDKDGNSCEVIRIGTLADRNSSDQMRERDDWQPADWDSSDQMCQATA